jgi:transcriptional antiterminator RfaH
MLRWFAVNTHPHAESRAAINLERQGFGVYLPRYRGTRRHARRIEQILRPLFPGYLFVRFDAAAARWRAIRSTTGVRDLVLTGDEPGLVSDQLVSEIRAREDDQGLVKIANQKQWRLGEELKITRGPLSELIGLFHGMTDSERVVVLLRLLGREMQITLPPNAIDALT